MQMNEELVRKITQAVLDQMRTAAPTNQAQPVASYAGKERLNAQKTDYSKYPKAEKRTDPKEVVIGVGAAFQREIKKTICGIPLDEVIKNI